MDIVISSTYLYWETLATTKGPWKYIFKQQGLITSRICHKVGDGTTTLFWIDPWVTTPPLALHYSHLYRLSHCKENMVKEVWNTNSSFWNLRLGRNLKDEEALEWADHSLDHALIVLS